MADATRNIPNSRATCGPASELLFPLVQLDSGVQFYQGAAVFRDPADSMYLKTSPSGNPLWRPYGVSAVKQLGDGYLKGEIAQGPHVFDNASGGDEILSTLPLGWPVYAKDNRTASLTWGGGLYPMLGWFGGMTGESTPRPIVWVGFCPFALTEINIPLVKGHADLVAAATSESFTLYTTPGPVRVIDPGSIDSLTLFSGGGTGSATVAFGISTGSDVDAIGNETDVFTGAAAAPKAMGAGVLGYSGAPIASGVGITATFATDTTVAAFSAGAIVASVRLRPGS